MIGSFDTDTEMKFAQAIREDNPFDEYANRIEGLVLSLRIPSEKIPAMIAKVKADVQALRQCIAEFQKSYNPR